MAITQFIFTLFCTVGFCLGLCIVTEEGQILYFLRKPFDKKREQIEINKNKIEVVKQFNPASKEIELLERENRLYSQILYAMKPVLLCITCFASLWGVSVFIYLNGMHTRLIGEMILNSFIAAFINTFIWKLYERL